MHLKHNYAILNNITLPKFEEKCYLKGKNNTFKNTKASLRRKKDIHT